jgi:lipoyl(octanoyl) transferase
MRMSHISATIAKLFADGPEAESFRMEMISRMQSSFPRVTRFFARSSLAIYSDLHDAIREALKANGIDAKLANSVSPKVSENCFANAVRADVISQGRKIAGAAHRRSRAGLLHQGSIQNAKLPHRFIDDFTRILCDQFERGALSQKLIDRATTIAQAKYGTIEWLMRR